MCDGIRFTFIDLAFVNALEHNYFSNINRIIDEHGELNSYKVEIKGLSITTYARNGYTIIKGSLHKYYNNGKHNHNDYTFKDLRKTIAKLMNELNINPEIALISNLEFGVNITTLFNPDMFLNQLIRHKDKGFNVMKVTGKGNGRSCSYNQYEIKIYNKGLQYGVSSNLLRIEKKVMRMCALKWKKIYLNDLLDISLWEHCKTELLNILNDLTINEPINELLLNNHQLQVYSLLPNHAKWSAYSKNNKSRYRKIYKGIISAQGEANYYRELKDLISRKCDELTNANDTILHYN
ncbi:hypothetical protein ACVWYG_000579 [Pedobacter sp. UYEF25]